MGKLLPLELIMRSTKVSDAVGMVAVGCMVGLARADEDDAVLYGLIGGAVGILLLIVGVSLYYVRKSKKTPPRGKNGEAGVGGYDGYSDNNDGLVDAGRTRDSGKGKTTERT